MRHNYVLISSRVCYVRQIKREVFASQSKQDVISKVIITHLDAHEHGEGMSLSFTTVCNSYIETVND